MRHIYSSDNYHLTFFTEQSKARVLQDFIKACTENNFTYNITPYGITSVAVLKSDRQNLVEVFEKFFPEGKKQETMVLDANTVSNAFVPFNPSFLLDLELYIGSKEQVIKQDILPKEILHFLNLHEEMSWDFIEKTMSLPSSLGEKVFIPGQILTRFEKETYFNNLEEITPHLGKHGYFQYLYKNKEGKTAFCKRYYHEGENNLDTIQPTHRGQIPTPVEYVIVKPMWYDCEYK